jgi:predicted transcriptional regulator
MPKAASAQDRAHTDDALRRIALEAEGLARARASAEAGKLIDSDEIDAWIDSLGTDRELPPPPSRL